MPDFSARINELKSLENFSAEKTVVHRLHPLVKLLSTFIYIALVASFGRYEFVRLTPYLFYPFVMMALAELPYRLFLPRLIVVLPFCLVTGLFNVFLDRATALDIGGVMISFGVLSLATILLKMYLCVMAAMLLVATTPFTELTAQLRRLYVPLIFVMVFEITFRYIGVLFEEAHSMTIAYKLRSGGKKALKIRYMGAFAGQILLRGFDRAESVHAAMCCRGYSLEQIPPKRRRLAGVDIVALITVCVPSLVFRLFSF